MPRDTKRTKQLLDNAKSSRALVRAELKDGASLQHIYDELGAHEQFFSNRLKELNEFNSREESKKQTDDAEKAQAARAQKLAETKVILLAKPIEELKKIAAGTKAVIEIKADTTIAEIVDAILKTAPENI